MFTNCIDNNICQRDSAVDEIMTNFVEANNKRMNYTWETNANKWENWESNYYKLISLLISKNMRIKIHINIFFIKKNYDR